MSDPKSYWNPAFTTGLSKHDRRVIEAHEELHRQHHELRKKLGRPIGMPDHVADARIEQAIREQKGGVS
jgi:hypothetical protein